MPKPSFRGNFLWYEFNLTNECGVSVIRVIVEIKSFNYSYVSIISVFLHVEW